MKYKVSFEMDLQDFENLTMMIHEQVVKFKYASQTDENLSKAEKNWHKKHGDYIEKDILNKIINGAVIVEK